MKNVLIAVIVTILVVGSGSFYGGMVYGKSKSTSNRNGQAFAQFSGGGDVKNGSRRGNGFVNGSILSKDDKSITVKLRSGGPGNTGSSTTDTGSKIILLSTSTTVSKYAAGSVSDLNVGDNITVNGTANADGSITATTINIQPAGQGAPGAPTK